MILFWQIIIAAWVAALVTLYWHNANQQDEEPIDTDQENES